jgi:hypothetical protein
MQPLEETAQPIELRPGLARLLEAVDALLAVPITEGAEGPRLRLAVARERFRQATDLRSAGMQVSNPTTTK